MFELLNKIIESIAVKNNLLRLSGLMAIFGMLIIFICDYKLLYLPLSIKEYSTFRAALSHSYQDIMIYSKLAVFATPFVLIGLFHLYIILVSANKIFARVTVGVYVFAYFNAALYYAFLAFIMTSAQLIEPLKLDLPYMIRHFYGLLQMQYYMGIITGSILFFFTLSFFKNSFYPKWFIFINPLYMIGLFRLILPMGTPPVVSGFLITVTFNLAMLFTFVISTVMTWNKIQVETISVNS